MSTDFHNKEFDDGTRIKLEILREYLKQWLPVFLAGEKTYWKKIFIYDFFSLSKSLLSLGSINNSRLKNPMPDDCDFKVSKIAFQLQIFISY